MWAFSFVPLVSVFSRFSVVSSQIVYMIDVFFLFVDLPHSRWNSHQYFIIRIGAFLRIGRFTVAG